MSLQDNAAYLSSKQAFAGSGIDINLLQGFVLGLLCNQFSTNTGEALAHVKSLLNDNEALSGNQIANFTTLCIHTEQQLKLKQLDLFIAQVSERPKKGDKSQFYLERLQALQNTAYGLTLGLALVPKSLEKMRTLIFNPKFQDTLYTLMEITKLELEIPYDEQSFQTVVEYIQDSVYELYHDAQSIVLKHGSELDAKAKEETKAESQVLSDVAQANAESTDGVVIASVVREEA